MVTMLLLVYKQAWSTTSEQLPQIQLAHLLTALRSVGMQPLFLLSHKLWQEDHAQQGLKLKLFGTSNLTTKSQWQAMSLKLMSTTMASSVLYGTEMVVQKPHHSFGPVLLLDSHTSSDIRFSMQMDQVCTPMCLLLGHANCQHNLMLLPGSQVLSPLSRYSGINLMMMVVAQSDNTKYTEMKETTKVL